MFSSKKLTVTNRKTFHKSIFRQLSDMEAAAIPRRREVLDVEVRRQRLREDHLQKAYSDAILERDQMLGHVNTHQMEAI